jgi:hypothetical protein
MKNLGIGLLIVVLIAFIVIGPFVTIWSLNTLFGLSIDYTFWTWLAVVWLSLVTFGSIASSTQKRN